MAYCVAVPQADGITATYELQQKDVTLRGGRNIRIHYFVKTDTEVGRSDFVVETTRSNIPFPQAVNLARALVRVLGMANYEAAHASGELKALTEGMGEVQRQEVIQLIVASLENHE